MSYGPNPWQQAHWDWRAAGNFIGGGAGSGLIVMSLVWPAGAVSRPGLLIAGLALILTGLMCVWLEIGRPLRALNVFRHPQRSWMSREAIVAAALFPCALAALLGWPGFAAVTLALALAFLYCQSRMLPAARGIPAWREPMLGWLVLVTGLAEGTALLLCAESLLGGPEAAQPMLMMLLTLLLLGRLIVWFQYQKRVEPRCAAAAWRALDGAGGLLQGVGTVLPIVLLAVVAAGVLPAVLEPLLTALAGLAAWGAGAWLKYCLVTRAGFNQGFALKNLPVRGVRP